jgi:FkbM family methyltransferase
MHVFIDGGGNWRRTVDRYLKLSKFDEVYVFEPNPIFYASYEGSDFKLIKKAIWVEDCKMSFFPSRDDNQVAGSLLREKMCKIRSNGATDFVSNYWHDEIQVECVDFSAWIKNNLPQGCRLTLKLDIEGAEYEVLWKMIKENTIKMVDELYVEFHSDTLPEKKNFEYELKIALKDFGIEPLEWD